MSDIRLFRRVLLALAFGLCVVEESFADAPIPVSALGADYRVEGRVIRGKGCLYAIGGGNVWGLSQVVRVDLGPDGTPTGKKSVGKLCDGGCGNCSGAVLGKWLFVTGGDLKGVTVRFEVLPDGSLTNRTEFSDGDRPKVSAAALVASGRYLVLLGGWQTRQVYAAEVKDDGSLGLWEKQRPLPSICFCNGRAFRIGNRLYVSGNATFKGATDRVFSCEVGVDGKPAKWRRWAELPECTGGYLFEALPDGKGVFYASLETGDVYTAPIITDGEIGEWTKKGAGILPTGPYVSLSGITLTGNRYLRYAIFADNPREFKPADIIRY